MGKWLDKDGLIDLKTRIKTKVDTKVDKYTEESAGKFLQTDSNGNAVWGTAASPSAVAEATEQWLDDHVSGGSTIAVDDSLTVEGAAADAKATGALVKSAATQPTDSTNKLWINESSETEYQVPTLAEHNDLKSAFDAILNGISIIYGHNQMFDKSNPGEADSQVLKTGDIIADTGSTHRYASPFIPVSGTNVVVSGYSSAYAGGSVGMACYDENKNFVRGSGTNTMDISGARYIRVTVDSADLNTYQVEYGTISTAYQSFEKPIYMQGQVVTNKGNIDTLQIEQIVMPLMGRESFNPACIRSIKVEKCPNVAMYIDTIYRRRYDNGTDNADAVRYIQIRDVDGNFCFAKSLDNSAGNTYPTTIETLELTPINASPYKNTYRNMKCYISIDWTKAPKSMAAGTFNRTDNTKIAPMFIFPSASIETGSRWNGKNVLVLGDSISTDAYLGYSSWATQWADETNATLVNPSVHAVGYLCGVDSATPNENSLVNLIDTLHETYEDNDDFDLIVFFRGTNDYGNNIPIGNTGDSKTTSFTGAVEYCFKKAWEYWSKAQIVVFTPMQRRTEQLANSTGKTLLPYSELIKEKAEYMSFPVLDLYHNSGFLPIKNPFGSFESGNSDFCTQYTLQAGGSPDGLHPNELFTTSRLVPTIKAFLENI